MRTSSSSLLLIAALLSIVAAAPGFAAPAVNVVRIWDSVPIDNGGYVQFHAINLGGSDSRRFRIENTGDAVLRLISTSLVSGPCFTQIANPITPIPAGANTTFRIDFAGCSPGFYSATVRILSNDPVTPSFSFTIGGEVLPPPSPNIAVFRPNGNAAAHGSTFEFATIPTGAQDIRRFRIDNAGTLPLNLTNASSIVSGVCFSQTETPLTPIAPGTSTYVSIRFSCGSGGTYAGAMTISSDDPDTNPYIVNLTGTATVPLVPDIAVFSPSAEMPRNGSYAFGSVPVGAGDVRRFRIDNTGNGSMDIGDPAHLVWGNCFTQTETPVRTVPPGGSSFFSIQFQCAAAGTYTADVIIPSDDPDENPYRFTVSATATPLPVPDIGVFNPVNASVGMGSSYAFGSVTAGTADTRRFRIGNSGNAALNIGNASTLVSGTCFSQTESPSTPIPAGGSSWFSVRFLCGSAGSYSGAVTIMSDDPGQNPFTFNLTASAIAGVNPDIAVKQNWDQVAVATGGTSVFPDPVGINQTSDRQFRIDNTGGAALSISNPTTLVSGACFSQLDTAPSTIAAGGNAVIRVRLSCATAGTATGKITIQSNDPDENPYIVNLSGTVVRNNAAVVSQVIPAVMQAGAVYDATVTMKNTGGTTWTAAAKDRLGIRPDSAAGVWNSTGRVDLGASESIAPGATKTFSFKLTAPATVGSYSLQWRMVEEFVEWFGETTPLATVTVVKDDATFVSQSVPSSMTTGATYPASVTMKNSGTTTWSTNFKLGSVTPGNPFGASAALPSNVSVPPGATYTFSFNVTAPSTAGSYVFQWRMQNSATQFGAATPAVTVNVQAIPAPVVDVVEPENIPAGTASLVTMYGSNLAGATVRFPPRANGTVTPTVQVVSGSATKLTVRVDATNPDVDGFQGMFIETSGGRAGVSVRVVPNRPVIDSYTPSEVSFGDIFYVGMSGANLDGAIVTTTSPSVQFVGIETSDALITGVLYAQSGSGSIDADLIITRPGGGSTHLPLALRDRSEVTKEMRLVAIDAAEDLREGVYIQNPVVLSTGDFIPVKPSPQMGRMLPPKQTDIEFSCDFSRTRSRGHSGMVVLLQNPLTHKPDPNILSALAIGEPRLFESLIAVHTFSFIASVNVHCDFDNPGFIDVDFCLAIHAAFEIVGVGGQSVDFEACTGTNSFVSLHGSGFVTFAYRLGDESSGSSCSTIEDVSPDPVLGYREGRVTLNQCCSDPVSIDAVFNISEENGGGQREVHGRLGQTAPKPDCRAPGCAYNVEIRAFIISDHVLGAAFCNDTSGRQLYFLGDDRGFQPSPGPERARLEHTFCADNGAAQAHCGLSKNFAPDSIVNDRISDEAFRDTHEGDCHFLDWSGRQTPQATLTQVEAPPGVRRWRSVAHAVHPHSIQFTPAIDWDLTIEVDTNFHPAKVFVSGTHDGFPAYEVWVNNFQIYGWDTRNSGPWELFPGNSKDVDCTRQLGQNPCIAMDPP